MPDLFEFYFTANYITEVCETNIKNYGNRNMIYWRKEKESKGGKGEVEFRATMILSICFYQSRCCSMYTAACLL